MLASDNLITVREFQELYPKGIEEEEITIKKEKPIPEGYIAGAEEIYDIVNDSTNYPQLFNLLLRYNYGLLLGDSKGRKKRIEKYIDSFFEIEEGINGTAYYTRITELDSDNDRICFVAKFCKNREDILNEYAVTKFGTNTLVNEIPNFVYMFGAMNAPKNKFTIKRDYSDVVPVILLEMAQGRNYLCKGANISQVEEILTQVFLALTMANERFDYTHYDLHNCNILVQRLDFPLKILYKTSFGDFWISSRLIPKIFDYSESYVNTPEGEYGNYCPVMGAMKETNSMVDVLKLLQSVDKAYNTKYSNIAMDGLRELHYHKLIFKKMNERVGDFLKVWLSIVDTSGYLFEEEPIHSDRYAVGVDEDERVLLERYFKRVSE